MLTSIEKVLGALEKAEARYLVVGGVAVVLHGVLRTTLDLDLVVDLEEENIRRVLEALEDLGFQPRAPVPMASFAEAETRASWVREKNLTVFSLWHPDDRTFAVDLFVESPFDFETAHRRAIRTPLSNTTISVVSIEDLLEMKKAAGRDRDHEDIRRLEDLLEMDVDDAS